MPTGTKTSFPLYGCEQ